MTSSSGLTSCGGVTILASRRTAASANAAHDADSETWFANDRRLVRSRRFLRMRDDVPRGGLGRMPIRERRAAGAQAAAFIAKWRCCCRPFFLFVERMQLQGDMCRKKWLTRSLRQWEKGGKTDPQIRRLLGNIVPPSWTAPPGGQASSQPGKVQVRTHVPRRLLPPPKKSGETGKANSLGAVSPVLLVSLVRFPPSFGVASGYDQPLV